MFVADLMPSLEMAFSSYRVHAYIRNEWASNVVDPDGKEERKKSTKSDLMCSQLPNIPTDGWQSLKEAFIGKAPHEVFSFTNAEIINYFVVRTAVDGKPADDMKAINSSAMNLFRCGHIQDIRVCCDNYMFIQAKCLPEMRKDRLYKLLLFLDLETSDIVAAECDCPAERGPYASCKHIGAICYSLEEFSRFGHLPEFLTCTDRLQQWNRPRPKKLDIIPVANLTSRRSELLIKESKSTSISTFDPRQPEHRKNGTEAIENLRCGLLSLDQHCAFLDFLVPSVDKINHDHKYSLPPVDEVTKMTVEVNDELEEEITLQYPSERHEAKIKLMLNVSLKERERIERDKGAIFTARVVYCQVKAYYGL